MRWRTIILTTQYLDEAEQLADRIAILHEGRIIANGTLAELKKLSNQPVGKDIWVAFAWCLGIPMIAYLFAMRVYKRKAA